MSDKEFYYSLVQLLVATFTLLLHRHVSGRILVKTNEADIHMQQHLKSISRQFHFSQWVHKQNLLFKSPLAAFVFIPEQLYSLAFTVYMHQVSRFSFSPIFLK